LLGVIGAGVAVFLVIATDRVYARTVAVIALSCATGQFLSGSQPQEPSPKLANPSRPVVMGLDTGLLERPSLDPWTGDGAIGLSTAFGRAGALPVRVDLLRERTRLERLHTLGIVQPTRPLPGTQAARLLSFVERGGHLLIGVDAIGATHLQHLLRPLGLGVLDSPLGNVPFRGDAPGSGLAFPSFRNAWIVSAPPGAQVHYEYEGLPIFVEVARGRGSVALVGDATFLTSGRLDADSTSFPANVDLVVGVLRRWVQP
jgi:hypothetical protein